MSYCAHCGAEVARNAVSCASCFKPPRSHPRVAGKSRSSSTGITALVVLVVGIGAVGFIGILAAIFIPNFIDALQKAKQKRTVADVREVGTAWMSWLTDEVSAAAAGASTTYDVAKLEQVLSAAELQRQLRAGPSGTPYIDEVPALDGWGHAFEYRQSDNLLGAQVMSIRSPGRDGVFSGTRYVQGSFDVGEFDQDIVWADGFFLRYPGTTGIGGSPLDR